MSDIDPLAQIEIQQRIRDLVDDANSNTTNHALAVEEAYDAKRAFEVSRAKAYLTATGTVPEREATALLSCEAAYSRHMAAEAVLKASEQAGRNIRASLEACRTLASDIRAAVTYATGEGG